MQTSPNFAVSTVGKALLEVMAVAVVLVIIIRGGFDVSLGLLDALSHIAAFLDSVPRIITGALGYFGDWIAFGFKYLDKTILGTFFWGFVKYEEVFTVAGGHLIVMATLFLAEMMFCAFHSIKIYRIAQSETISAQQASSAVVHCKKVGGAFLFTFISGGALLVAALSGMVYRAVIDAAAPPQINAGFACVLVLSLIFYLFSHATFEFPAFLLPREMVKFANVQLNGLWGSYRASSPIQRLRESVIYRYEFQNSYDAGEIARVAKCKPQGV